MPPCPGLAPCEASPQSYGRPALRRVSQRHRYRTGRLVCGNRSNRCQDLPDQIAAWFEVVRLSPPSPVLWAKPPELRAGIQRQDGVLRTSRQLMADTLKMDAGFAACARRCRLRDARPHCSSGCTGASERLIHRSRPRRHRAAFRTAACRDRPGALIQRQTDRCGLADDRRSWHRRMLVDLGRIFSSR